MAKSAVGWETEESQGRKSSPEEWLAETAEALGYRLRVWMEFRSGEWHYRVSCGGMAVRFSRKGLPDVWAAKTMCIQAAARLAAEGFAELQILLREAREHA